MCPGSRPRILAQEPQPCQRRKQTISWKTVHFVCLLWEKKSHPPSARQFRPVPHQGLRVVLCWVAEFIPPKVPIRFQADGISGSGRASGLSGESLAPCDPVTSPAEKREACLGSQRFNSWTQPHMCAVGTSSILPLSSSTRNSQTSAWQRCRVHRNWEPWKQLLHEFGGAGSVHNSRSACKVRRSGCSDLRNGSCWGAGWFCGTNGKAGVGVASREKCKVIWGWCDCEIKSVHILTGFLMPIQI